MLVSIAIADCTPKEAAEQLQVLGVDGATLWVCEGYAKGWPLESVTMIRLTVATDVEAIIVADKLARAFNQEAAYLEMHDRGYLVYKDGVVDDA